jgi:uncharacterized membrane protein
VHELIGPVLQGVIFTLKLIHVLGAAVLFGTGLGIAFFMLMAHRTRDPAAIAHTARIVVIADALFTAGAVIVQPVSGGVLAWTMGYSLGAPWIVTALGLYIFIGMCWIPVVAIQLRLRDIAAYAAKQGAPLPADYFGLFRIWFWLGWPAFTGMVGIFALMIWKPQLW